MASLIIALLLFGLTLIVVVGILKLKKVSTKAHEITQELIEKEEQLKRLLTDYQNLISQYKSRFKIIEPHLGDYFNTIPPKCHHLVQTLRVMIDQQEDHGFAIERVLKSHDSLAYDQAINDLTIFLETERGDNIRLDAPQDNNNLQDQLQKIEELLCEIGEELYIASVSQEFSLPKPHGRRPTLDSLQMAGVLEKIKERNNL